MKTILACLILSLVFTASIVETAAAKQGSSVRKIDLQARTPDGKFGQYPSKGSIMLKRDGSSAEPYMTIGLVNFPCANRPNKFYALYAIVGDAEPVRLRNFNPSCIHWIYNDTYSSSSGYHFGDNWFTEPITFEIWQETDDGYDEVDGWIGNLFMYGSD